jgi:hypothetical protein
MGSQGMVRYLAQLPLLLVGPLLLVELVPFIFMSVAQALIAMGLARVSARA